MSPRCLFLLALWQLAPDAATAQDLQSPCPSSFVYEPAREPDRWYGVATLRTDSELSGVWLRVILDRAAVQLGNWFGEVETTDNREFLIRKRNHRLPVGAPLAVRFYVRYDASGPAPRVVEVRLNARTFCPEGAATTAGSTTDAPLMTSAPLAAESPLTTAPTAGANDVEEATRDAFFIRPQVFEGEKPDPSVFGVDQAEQEGEECGIVPATAVPIISHGVRPASGEFPWHAAVYHSFGAGLQYACGGSLVSRLHVLTAGHCVTDGGRTGTPALLPDQIVVHLGKDNLKEWSSSTYQVRDVAAVYRHPRYDARRYGNDIAVVKLASAARFTDAVRPVCVWETEEDVDEMAGRIGVIAGFGYDERGTVAYHLIKTQMPVIKQTTCIFSFPNFYSRFASQKTFCAGFRNGTTVCNGDSGGGLAFSKLAGEPPREVFSVRGVASVILQPSASDGDRKCSPEHYPVFTDVAKHLAFVRECLRQ